MRQRDCVACGKLLEDFDYKGSAIWNEVHVCVACLGEAAELERMAAKAPRTSWGDRCPACDGYIPDRCDLGCPHCWEPRPEPEAA